VPPCRIPDMHERAIMQEIARLRDEEGLSWRKISDLIEQQLCCRQGRPFTKSAFADRMWPYYGRMRAYKAWKKLLEESAQQSGTANGSRCQAPGKDNSP
jgi:hypothetical protein